MGVKGRRLSDEAILRIVQLLSSTDIPIKEIAERSSCSRSVVVSINRKFQVRRYAGLRSNWLRGEEQSTVSIEDPAV